MKAAKSRTTKICLPELKLSNRPPIVELQGTSAERVNMRINPNQRALPVPESDRSSNANSVTKNGRALAGSPLGEDQAQLSGVRVHVPALAAQVMQFPEVRQERVNALRQAVLEGSYQPSAVQVADALLDHMGGAGGLRKAIAS
jgi:flagellar biosynthesis anti-sigma factor FlgM